MDTACRKPRHVWRFLRPLNSGVARAAGEAINLLKHFEVQWSKVSVWHWAVVVTELEPEEMIVLLHRRIASRNDETRLSATESEIIFGDMYELRRVGSQNTLVVRKQFNGNDLDSKWDVLLPSYVGTTTATDSEIFNMGTKFLFTISYCSAKHLF
jgi:hypothetical protein